MDSKTMVFHIQEKRNETRLLHIHKEIQDS